MPESKHSCTPFFPRRSGRLLTLPFLFPGSSSEAINLKPKSFLQCYRSKSLKNLNLLLFPALISPPSPNLNQTIPTLYPQFLKPKPSILYNQSPKPSLHQTPSFNSKPLITQPNLKILNQNPECNAPNPGIQMLCPNPLARTVNPKP